MKEFFKVLIVCVISIVLIIIILSCLPVARYYNEKSVSRDERVDAYYNAMSMGYSAEAHNAIAETHDSIEFITYDKLMSIDTVDEFNSICELDLSDLKDEAFNIAKEYTLQDSDGYMILNEEYDHTK